MKSILLLAIFMIATTFSFSQSIEERTKKSVKERASSASYVFEGKVIEQYSFWDDQHHEIYTANVIELSRIFKGDIQTDLVKVVTLGGIVEDRFSMVLHSFSLKNGEEGIFFCHPSFVTSDAQGNNYPTMATEHGELGFIKFNQIGGAAKARDRFGTYKRIREDIYNPILSASDTDEFFIQTNSWDKKEAEALARYSSEIEFAATTIELTFDNIQLSGSGEYLEFDIMAQANTSGILFGKGDVHIQYDTDAFGSNIVQSGAVEVTKGEIIQGGAYSLTVSDESQNTVEINIGSVFTDADTAYALSVLPEKMFHMKVSVDNIAAVLIAMDTPSMSGNVWYYDDDNDKYIAFDDIMVENPITQNDVVSIREFYPNPITAGTFDTLTIEGENFGDNALAISFTGADLNEDITSITTSDAELVFWSDTLIRAIVPSNATFGSAGTGIITIHTLFSGDIQSDSSLNVRYSVLNNKAVYQM